jgi:fructose-1,6-bisphosphatase I
MTSKNEKIKLTKWLEKTIPHYFPNKGELISLIEIIAESTIPIRGLLEKGITSREIQYRMNIEEIKSAINIYDEEQIHEDILTHSIILKAIQDANEVDFSFIASEEAEPILSNGIFGITTDPVDGSSNVAVNRTVGTIVGIYDIEGNIVCAFYVLYGIFTNLVIAINGIVAEFILDTSPYSMTFYHYVFYELKSIPNRNQGGIRCLGGDSKLWSDKCKNYEGLLIEKRFKDRYSGSFVGDFHAIINYGGVYAYFPQNGKGKLRLYYEWLPLGFIAKTLGGELIIIEEGDKISKLEQIERLTKRNIRKIHASTCGGLIGSKFPVDWFLEF